MSDYDRLAAIVLPALPGGGYPPTSLGAQARVSLSLAITDALIAAGVTMPAPETEDCTDE